MNKFIKTDEKIEVPNYPYGFKLKTTLYDYVEFDKKKGYRHVKQTMNPKTNRLNAPKKSTYYDFFLRTKDEKGHIKIATINFNVQFEKLNNVAKLISQIYNYLTNEEKQYIIATFIKYLKISVVAEINFAKADKNKATEQYNIISKYIQSNKNNANIFKNMPEIKL